MTATVAPAPRRRAAASGCSIWAGSPAAASARAGSVRPDGAWDRDRDRGDGGGPRDRRIESRDPAGRARPDRFEPADGGAGPDDVRRGRHAAGRSHFDDRPVGPVEGVSAVSIVDATVRRTDQIPSGETGGIAVQGADPSLLQTLEGDLAAGRFIDDAVGRYPAVVLGAIAADRLGITSLDGQPLVWIADRWWAVVGILEPLPLAPEIDRSALVGMEAAREYLDTEASPTTIYVRAADDYLDDVRSVLPATSNPESPEAVNVSRPSDAIEARAAAATAFTTLFLGLGAVALLVGGLGIANVMLMAVLERRNEIGLRRALGATRGHIVGQFLTEAILLAGAGGVVGAVLGSAVAAAYATSQAWVVALPIAGCVAGVLGAAAVGGIAGLYPAIRAANLAPTDSLRA